MVSTQLILLTNQLASHWLQTQLRLRCFHKLVVLALEGKIQTSSSDSQGCPPLIITMRSCPVDWALKWILSYYQANAKTQWVLKLSSNSHCDNSVSAVAKEVVVGWHLSFAVAPKYFQKHCSYRKFLVYVYTLTQSTGPKLYQLIFLWMALLSSDMFCKILAAYFAGRKYGRLYIISLWLGTFCPMSVFAATATIVLFCS